MVYQQSNTSFALESLRARRLKIASTALKKFIKDECEPRKLDVVLVDTFGEGIRTSTLGDVFYEKNTIWLEDGKDNLMTVAHEVAHWITAFPKNRKKPNFGLSDWDYEEEELAVRVQMGLYYKKRWGYLKMASEMNMQEFYTDTQLQAIAKAYVPVWDQGFRSAVTDMGIPFRL